MRDLAPSTLIRAITTPKRFIVCEAGKIKFTNIIPRDLDNVIFCLDEDITALQYHCQNLRDRISKSWGFNCYYYDSFESFLRVHGLKLWQWIKLNKWLEE